MKCWIFEETGEIKRGREGKWISLAEIKTNGAYRLVKLTEYLSNPLDPIMEVAGLARSTIKCLEKIDFRLMSVNQTEMLILAQAVEACIEIMEGKPFVEKD